MLCLLENHIFALHSCNSTSLPTHVNSLHVLALTHSLNHGACQIGRCSQQRVPGPPGQGPHIVPLEHGVGAGVKADPEARGLWGHSRESTQSRHATGLQDRHPTFSAIRKTRFHSQVCFSGENEVPPELLVKLRDIGSKGLLPEHRRSKGISKEFKEWIAIAKDRPKWRQQNHSKPKPPDA